MQYQVYFAEGYGQYDRTTQDKAPEFFSHTNGYEEEDIQSIEALLPGEEYHLDTGLSLQIIRRIA